MSTIGCTSRRVDPQWVYFPPPPATPHVVHLASFNSLGELVPPRVTTGNLLRGGAPSPYVQKPAGVDYQNDHLYICDTGLNVVHDWNLATGASRRIGQRGDAILQKPVDVAVSADGMIFVADTERQEVVAFDVNGNLDETYRTPDRTEYRPTAVCCLGDESIFVADVAGHDVDFFDVDFRNGGFFADVPGHRIGSLRTSDKIDVEVYYPTGVAVRVGPRDIERATPNEIDYMVVADAFNARVIRFGPGTNEVHYIGQTGDRYGDLGQPKHLDVGPDGVIFVADAAFRCVHLFNQEGQLLMLLGGPEDQPGRTPMPLGVTVAESLPENLHRLVPPDFDAHYFLFITNTIGSKRISLYAVGLPRA